MNKTVTGNVISVKRFEIHDGDGIRTTLFLKGCPLSCRWCHNPESIAAEPILAYYERLCIGCGRCVSTCPKQLHSMREDGSHVFRREDCIHCGACATICPASALVLYGREVTVEEILPVLLADMPFYQASGGGVTLSGGEPLLQPRFCRELLARLKEAGVSTAVDTCGFENREAIDAVLEYTDTFLFDVKALDEALHIQATGQSNQKILENLRYIDGTGKRLEVRIPYIPGYNDNQIQDIGEMLGTLQSLACVKVLPYHDYAEDKYEAVGRKEDFCKIPVPGTEEMERVRDTLRRLLPGIVIE